ncbi:DUF2188 domain-containing protein [Amycolatopsis carbonis]|uniref:DUF2188 domain-containing protein n=1 Tax=Amycolatopsis carbonis TaxID=715471 RepID=A0A9Y2IN70_9PSEU|nr:DUF2188 domain-containing protein [Amycolatopsis sp. 2-15]WIX83009.1 DUF2188 domain-containing protein [Amycolatopsis sp. 2-15]
MKGDIETFFEGGQWKNKVEGSSRVANIHDTKEAATSKGRDMARERKVEHFIRNKDGRIGERNTYGHDPRNIPG